MVLERLKSTESIVTWWVFRICTTFSFLCDDNVFRFLFHILLRLRVEKVFIAVLLLGLWGHHRAALHFVEALSWLMYILFYWSARSDLTIRFFGQGWQLTILYPLCLRDCVQIFVDHTLRVLDNLSKFYHDLPKANIALCGGHRPCCTQSADSLAAASTFREDTGPCWPEFPPEAVLRVVSKELRVNLNSLTSQSSRLPACTSLQICHSHPRSHTP